MLAVSAAALRRTCSTTFSIVASMRSLSSHSQMVMGVQPIWVSAEMAARSRSTLRRNFASQNSTLRLGWLGLHLGQRCQKQPLTKMAILRPGKAMSGLLGTFHSSAIAGEAGGAQVLANEQLGFGIGALVALHGLF